MKGNYLAPQLGPRLAGILVGLKVSSGDKNGEIKCICRRGNGQLSKAG